MGAGSGRERRWDGLRFAPVELDASGIGRLVEALRALYDNGGAIFICGAAEDAAAFDRVFREYVLREPALVRWLLGLPLVAGADPELGVRPAAKLAFDWGSPLALAGDLAASLAKGGAYSGFHQPLREAKMLGEGFCAALYGERYEEVEVCSTREAWADWFFDVAWDQSWIVVDRGLRRIAVLCVTDTD